MKIKFLILIIGAQSPLYASLGGVMKAVREESQKLQKSVAEKAEEIKTTLKPKDLSDRSAVADSDKIFNQLSEANDIPTLVKNHERLVAAHNKLAADLKNINDEYILTMQTLEQKYKDGEAKMAAYKKANAVRLAILPEDLTPDVFERDIITLEHKEKELQRSGNAIETRSKTIINADNKISAKVKILEEKSSLAQSAQQSPVNARIDTIEEAKAKAVSKKPSTKR